MPHVLDGLTVFDPDGRPLRLGELWVDHSAVLVFVRHFGCLFCRQQIAELSAQRDRLRSLGAELIVIGHGTIEEARALREELRLTSPIFTDPGRDAYRALGMRRGWHTSLSPRVILRAARARWMGFRQTRIAGDPFQQGGVVVIARGGEERYRFISREAGDHPRPSEIVAALQPRP